MGFVFIDVTPPVHPTVLALAWAQIVIYAIGYAVIAWQLWQMSNTASNHTLDESTQRLGQVLAETTQRLAAMRPDEAASKI